MNTICVVSQFQFSGSGNGPLVIGHTCSSGCRRISDMMVRLALVLFASTCLFAQCDDIEVSTKKAKHFSEVVFQGTVEGFKGSGADRTAYFASAECGRGK